MAPTGGRDKTGQDRCHLPVWGNRQDAEISARNLARLARERGGIPDPLQSSYRSLLDSVRPQYRDRFLIVLGEEDPALARIFSTRQDDGKDR